jgi:hypothetical protein
MVCGVVMAVAVAATSGVSMGQPGGQTPAAGKSADLPDTLFPVAEPLGAKSLAEARASAKVGDTVTVRARVSTAKDAFARGQSAFNVGEIPAAGASDPKKSVAATESAVVQVVDAAGTVLKTELKNRNGLAAGADVVVVGQLASMEAGKAMVIHASQVFVLPPDLPKGFILGAVPEGSKMVEEVKKAAKKGDTVVIRGRIGGSVEPFVDGRAVFTIVGPGIKSCAEEPDDPCKTPWDYCCETKADIVLHSATVQVLDGAGKPLKIGMKGRSGLKELSDVSVVGKVMSMEGKAMVVQATGLYIHPTAK